MNIKSSFSLSEQLSHLLNLLRASSAGVVLVGHIGMLLYENSNNFIFNYIIGFGHQAVMVFFVLSGFLVSRSAMIGIHYGRKGIVQYIIDRLVRLYIVLIPALLLTWLLDLVLMTWLSEAFQYSYIESRSGLFNLIGNSLFLQTIYFPVFGSNGPLWSLSNEFWYYLLFPLIMGAVNFRKRLGVVLLLIPIVLIFMMLPVVILKYFLIWLIGASIWAIRRTIIASSKIAWVIFIVVFMISGFEFLQIHYVGFCFDLMIAISLLILINNYRYNSEKMNIRWYYNLKVRVFADFSYSLYVVHFPILVLLSAYIMTQGITLTVSIIGFIEFIGVMIVVYFIAFLFARLTELNTNKVKLLMHKCLFAYD